MINDNKVIIDLLRKFISGEDRSKRIVEAIEVELDTNFPDDDEIQDYVTCYAMFSPGGGEYLYNESEITKACYDILNILQSKYNILT